MKKSHAKQKNITKLINFKLAAALNAGKVSKRTATKILVAAVEAFGVNVQTTSVSVATVHRARDRHRKEKANEIKNNFSKNLVSNAKRIVHWDDKKIKDPQQGMGSLNNLQYCSRVLESTNSCLVLRYCL